MTQPDTRMSNLPLYMMLFADELGDDEVEHVARIALQSSSAALAADKIYAGISEALTSDAVLTQQLPEHRHSEQDYRAFLARVLQRLDALRPWPQLPFYTLEASSWPEVRDGQLAARIKLSTLTVENRLRTHFYRQAGGSGRILVLRLVSGTEAALVPGWWPGSEDVALLQRHPGRPAAGLLNDFSAATGITRHDIEPVAQP